MKYEDRKDLVKSLIDEGLTGKEIAARAGIPSGSINSLLRRWGLRTQRNRRRYEDIRSDLEKMFDSGKSGKEIATTLGIPISTIHYLKRKWGLARSSGVTGKHDHKKELVAELLKQDLSVTEVARCAEIPVGSIGYLLAKWQLGDLQLHKRGIAFSEDGRRALSAKLKEAHALSHRMSKNHPVKGFLKVRGELVPEDEVRRELEEYIEQDLTLARMAELMEVDPKSITNRLKRFGLQRGLRSGERCVGGYEKYRGPDWAKQHKKALERDG